ncbi:hypothetical protein M3Y97_00670300 [Aphelenchoides bicaudatus]|nr:hypothetical protein M3Y97_00670300 [Aphelenchoides bicaudatus]
MLLPTFRCVLLPRNHFAKQTMLKKSHEQFAVKSPPIPFAVAVRRRSKLGCRVKLTAAAKTGRGFGVSFNEGDRVIFRLYFDTAYRKLHLCKDDDREIVDSLNCTYDFGKLFKLKVNLEKTLEIKIKNGPVFSVDNVTDYLDNVNLICIHGNVVVIKAILIKFLISSDEETAHQYSQTPTQRNLPPPPLIHPSSPFSNQQPQYPMTSTANEPPPSYQQSQVSSMPVYSGVIVEDKEGHPIGMLQE